MNLSGIYVLAVPDKLNSTVNALSQLAGVDVHYRDPESGRIIVTLDTASDTAQIEGLKKIQALPNIILAELVYHRFDDEELQSSNDLPVDQEEPMHPNQGLIQNYLNK